MTSKRAIILAIEIMSKRSKHPKERQTDDEITPHDTSQKDCFDLDDERMCTVDVFMCTADVLMCGADVMVCAVEVLMCAVDVLMCTVDVLMCCANVMV